MKTPLFENPARIYVGKTKALSLYTKERYTLELRTSDNTLIHSRTLNDISNNAEILLLTRKIKSHMKRYGLEDYVLTNGRFSSEGETLTPIEEREFSELTQVIKQIKNK